MKIGKKTTVTRELTRQEKNRRNNIKRLTVSFAVAFLLFIALLVIQSSILNQEEKQEVYQVVKDIPTGTKLSEETLNNYIQLKEVQVSLIPENYIVDKEAIVDKFTNRAYKARDIITSDGLTDVEKMYKDSIENPTEVSFSVGDMSAAVSGTIHEGDYINIYALRKNAITDDALASVSDDVILTDEYFTFMHVYVAEAYNGDGVRIGTDDTSGQKAVMFTIILSEKDVTTFNEMLKNCDIRLAKIMFDSDKTYVDFLKELNIDAATIQKKQEEQSETHYFWDIDMNDYINSNSSEEVEPGDTTPVDYSAETQEQLDAEAQTENQTEEQIDVNEQTDTTEEEPEQVTEETEESSDESTEEVSE